MKIVKFNPWKFRMIKLILFKKNFRDEIPHNLVNKFNYNDLVNMFREYYS